MQCTITKSRPEKATYDHAHFQKNFSGAADDLKDPQYKLENIGLENVRRRKNFKFPFLTLKIGNWLYDHQRKFSTHVTVKGAKGSKAPCEFYACVNVQSEACEFTCKIRSVHTRMVIDPVYASCRNWELVEITHKHTCKPLKNLNGELVKFVFPEKNKPNQVENPHGQKSSPHKAESPMSTNRDQRTNRDEQPSTHDFKSIRVEIARRATKRSTFPALTLRIDGGLYDHVRSNPSGKLISKGGFESIIGNYTCANLKKDHIKCRFTCRIRSVFSNDNSEEKFWNYKNWQCVEIFNTHTCRPGQDFEKKMNLSVSEYNSEDEFEPNPEESQEISLENLSKYYNETLDPSEAECSKTSSGPTDGEGPVIVSMRRQAKNSRSPIIRLKIGNDEFDCVNKVIKNKLLKQNRAIDKETGIYHFFCDQKSLPNFDSTCRFWAEFKTLFSNDYSGPKYWEMENWALLRIRTQHTCEPKPGKRISYSGPFTEVLPCDSWVKSVPKSGEN